MATQTIQAGVGGTVPAAEPRGYVDWPAIFAGAVLATAVSFVMLTFGAAIGLSMTSPFTGESVSAPGLAVAAAVWLLWVQVSSYMSGGYITGRMRARARDATEHESDIRDGAHGLVVWAVGVLFSAAVAATVLAGAVSGGAAVAGAAGRAIGTGGSGGEPGAHVTDLLLRGSRATGPEADAARQEILRMMTGAALRGGLSPDDRGYLGQLVARMTGMSPPDAERRVNEVLAQAKQAAEKARKTGIVAAFITAAALLAGAAGAWWAAQMGGTHRDQGADFSRLFRRRRVVYQPQPPARPR